MTRLLSTMNFALVIGSLVLHSMVLIHAADSTPDSLEKRPPIFKRNCHPTDDVMVYESNKEIYIPCQGAGDNAETLKYTYWWTKDGENITAVNTRYKNNPDCPWGLHISATNSSSLSAGKYQCFIYNGKGTAMSNATTLVEIGSLDQFKTPRKIDVTEGQPFHLTCDLGEKAKYLDTVKWGYVKDNSAESIPDDERITPDQNGTVWFSDFQKRKDVKKYVYRVILTGGETDVCTTELNIINSEKEQPKEIVKQFVSNPTEFATLGKKKLLLCIYDGKCSFNWTKDGQSLNPEALEGNVKIGISQKSLEIESFEIENEGDYSCVVTDTDTGNQVSKHDFTVKIGKPYFKKRNTSRIDIIEGRQIDLNCEAHDNQAETENRNASVQWIYNAKPINESSFYNELVISEDTFNLTIKKSGVKHVGNYGCNVSNSHGSSYLEISLDVAERQKCRIIDPSKEKPITIPLEVGNNVTYTCSVTGFPEPTFVWMNGTISLNHTNPRIIISDDQKTLTIKNITIEDAGEYWCSATCEEQEPLKLGFNLKIKEVPPPPPNIIVWIIVIIIIVIIVAAILIISKKRGYVRRIYNIKKREAQAANNQQDPRAAEQSEVSLLAGESSQNATLNLQRRNTQNGITLSEVQSRA